MYKVIFDNGKLYEEEFNTEEELKNAIKEFYDFSINNDYSYDFKVYNEKNEDISESQFITELVISIMED